MLNALSLLHIEADVLRMINFAGPTKDFVLKNFGENFLNINKVEVYKIKRYFLPYRKFCLILNKLRKLFLQFIIVYKIIYTRGHDNRIRGLVFYECTLPRTFHEQNECSNITMRLSLSSKNVLRGENKLILLT